MHNIIEFAKQSPNTISIVIWSFLFLIISTIIMVIDDKNEKKSKKPRK